MTSTYSLYTLKATILIFSFIIFYAIRKKIDFTFKYIFYSILSFAVISYCIKLVEFEFVVEIINLRFTIILASCFVIFFIFSKINISKNNIFFFVILLNLISLIFIYYINYDVYLRPINDNLLSGNRNTKNFFIFFTFFINSIIFCKFEKLSFKKFILFFIQILICFYILKYSNIYTKLSLLISLTFFSLFFILKKEIVLQIIKISLIFLIISICVIILLLIFGVFQETVYLVYYNFLKTLAIFKNVPAKDVCWELSLKKHDLDLVYNLHKKYPLNCWQFDISYFDHLWELWLALMLRAFYFAEIFNLLGNFNDLFFGLKNPNAIFIGSIFPHNSFFDLLVKFGIFVFLLSIIFILKIFKNFINEKNFFGSIFLLSVLLAMNLDDYLFGHRLEFTIIIWTIIGLISNDKFKNLKL